MNFVRPPGARIAVRKMLKCMWAVREKPRETTEGQVQVMHFRTQSPIATQASALDIAEALFKVSSVNTGMIPRGRARREGHKLKHMRFDLYVRKIFMGKVVKHRNRLPGEVLESQSLEIFKSWLGVVLDNLLGAALLDAGH